MKVYSIGREPGCDIMVNDNSNVVSRRHAVLNVSSTGKMTITDLSHNGTYVNGMRIATNVPVPVTRKDNISFAHVARLDWALVPNPFAYIKYVIAAVVAIILIVVGIICFKTCGKPSEPKEDPATYKVDSASIRSQEEKLKQQEQARKDSIKKAVEDSIKAANAAKVNKPIVTKSNNGTDTTKGKDKSKEAKKCSTCGKVISACEYKGKHPVQNDNQRRFR